MSRKTNEETMVWLYSMTVDPDSFNAINADNAIALIKKLRHQNACLAAHIRTLKKENEMLMKEMREDDEDNDENVPFYSPDDDTLYLWSGL